MKKGWEDWYQSEADILFFPLTLLSNVLSNQAVRKLFKWAHQVTELSPRC